MKLINNKEIERVLLIRQPWIQMIGSGVKTLEMRKHHTKIRGWIGLAQPSSGKISSIANLTDSIEIPIEHMMDPMYIKQHRLDPDKFDPGDYHFGWKLENVESCNIQFIQPSGAVIWVRV